MTQDTNIQITAGHVIAENRNRTNMQTLIVMSVLLIATTLMGITSIAAIIA